MVDSSVEADPWSSRGRRAVHGADIVDAEDRQKRGEEISAWQEFLKMAQF